jgi:cell division protease FtsH
VYVSRFIRSALFPILIVIIVAMFIEWVIQGNSNNNAPKAIYSAPGMASEQVLTNDLQSGFVRSVVIDPTSRLASVTQTGGVSYVTPVSDPVALQEQLDTSQPKVMVSEGAVSKPPVVPSFTNDVINGRVSTVVMNTKDQVLEVTLAATDGGKPTQYSVGYTDPAITTELLNQYQVAFDAKSPKSAWWTGALTFILPFILIIGFWIFIMNQMQGGGSKVMSFGKSKAKRVSVDSPKVTFKDVAGCDEAVEELHEIKEFLENPKKFQQLGARIPKGVLLFGPPGTGKTLLARAVAGEAGVPFFSISGSDFVEMFVGVGASRVRDLFEQAKQNAPCIIFVDEIDAVGRHRGAGMGGGHDEREQTLNQLLVEMDGFEMKDNIILIAATNRPDILDPALLRPGRFDRQIVVDRPDRPGRKAILEVHTRGKPISKDIDIDALAAQTPGFTGADLANLVNEAALLAARHGKKIIETHELEEGIMRVLAGPEKKTRIISEKEKAITAYHEMGHALVGHFLEHTDPVHKISVVSRGQALGYTISLPTEDKFLTTKGELMDTLAMTLGGRAAEEVVFGEITTGAANDLEKATATAKQMIMRFGMSEELGPRTLGHDQSMPFLGREFQQQADYSDEVARQIDDEIRRIIEEAHQTATSVLVEKREVLERISKVLIVRETLERREFEALLAGTSEEEVFREKDEKRGQQGDSETKPQRPAPRPQVGAPAPVSPLVPKAT